MSYDSDTTSTMDAVSFTYVKNSVEYSDYAREFITDEPTYYNYIKSYTTEDKVILFICEKGIVGKCASLDENGLLTDLETEKEFDSIVDWVSDYKGEEASTSFVFDNVFIGEDLVPLWKILVDLKEDDDLSDDDVEFDAELSMRTFEMKMVKLLLIAYVLLFANLLLFLYSVW